LILANVGSPCGQPVKKAEGAVFSHPPRCPRRPAGDTGKSREAFENTQF